MNSIIFEARLFNRMHVYDRPIFDVVVRQFCKEDIRTPDRTTNCN